MKKYIIKFLAIIVCSISYGQIEKTSTNQKDISKSINEYLERVEPFGFSGAVLVAKDGKVLLNKGYGLANRKTGEKNNSNSVFSTGSVTKQFTGAAIMKLEMQGKVKTEDKLSKYFNNVPKDKQNITLHNLLTHTSGLTQAFSEDDFVEISQKKYVDKSLNSELAFEPGNGFKYSNVGYVLLALIIEKQSGMSYEKFLNTHLFKPSGMTKTGYNLPEWKEENFVHLYDGDKDNGTTKIFNKPTLHLLGNGGIITTTEDMFLWVQALKNNTVLSKEATTKMFTPFRNNYAYGWDSIDDGNLRQHNGGSFLGCGAELRWFVNEDLMTIIFSNATINGKQGFSVVRNELEALSFGDEIPLPPKINKTNVDLSTFIGDFKMNSGNIFKIEGDKNLANLIVDNQEILDFILNPKEYKEGGINVQLNEKFDEAFKKALTKKDFSGFEFTGAVNELKSEITNELKLEGIDTPYHKIVHTIPSSRGNGSYVTDVAINDNPKVEGPAMILHIATKNENYLGMGVDFGFPGPISLSLIPVGKNTFEAYSMSSKMGMKVKIEKLNEKEYSFTIDGKSIKVNKI